MGTSAPEPTTRAMTPTPDQSAHQGAAVDHTGGRPPGPPRTRRQQPRRSGRWASLVALALLVAALTTVTVLLTRSNDSARAWQQEANTRSSELSAMTSERDRLAKDLKSTKSELADAATRYQDASDRIRSLADEKAQVGDQAAWLSQVTTLSKQITEQLDTCVSNLQKLQGYLTKPQDFEPDSLSEYARQVNEQCDQAKANSGRLADLLGAP